MGFYTYTTNQDACSKAGVFQDAEAFYRMAFAEARAVHSAQFYYQLRKEREREQAWPCWSSDGRREQCARLLRRNRQSA